MEGWLRQEDIGMYKICLFAGTTEGRKLARFLEHQQVRTTVCVATEYGGEMIPPSENITVLSGRKNQDEILHLLQEEGFDLVIDATHPYAASVTESIRTACEECSVFCHRVLREDSAVSEDAVYVENAQAAAEYLNHTEGSILLTTGSKELPVYTSIRDFADRVYARVLPMEASLQSCRQAGLMPSHIIAMQGPFDENLNVAMLQFLSAKWMVTKDGGDAGGFAAKAGAAARTGTRMIVIGRPDQKNGASYRETIDLLCRRYGCVRKPEVTIAGIGPGSHEAMTREVCEAIEHADCLIGARRMIEDRCRPGQGMFEAVDPVKILEFIRSHTEYESFAVLMSGDTGFFSGTKKLLQMLEDCCVRVLPGISSLVYLCARLQTAYEDVVPVSLHGRQHDIVSEVHRHNRVFVLVGGTDGIRNLCRTLTEAGLGNVKLSIGERLSYPDEKITVGTASNLADGSYESLSAALIEKETATDETLRKGQSVNGVITPGLPDDMFLRGQGTDGIVPMTKSEVRSICLSKLQLREDSVCWDLGAGTGSVAIEMALQASGGHIYAIEKKAEALDLMRYNQDRFQVKNLTVVEGSAPAVCSSLPAPDCAFIGGSDGQMRAILQLLMEKNPHVRVVATAVSLESIAELTACIHEFPFRETEVVSVSIARDRKAGKYHLMTGRNPIYIYTLQAGEELS